MRPETLYQLFRPLDTLKGIGPRLKNKLKYLIGENVIDLLWHLPSDVINRTYSPKVIDAEKDRIATFNLIVNKHLPSRRKNMPYKIHCSDETSDIDLIWFNARREYLEELLPIGKEIIVSGKIDVYKNTKQIIHPDYIFPAEQSKKLPKFEPVYRLTQGVSNKVIRRNVLEILNLIPDIQEWNDKNLLKKMNWPSFNEAIKNVHNPGDSLDISHNNMSRQRLAYDELLANQISLSLISKNFSKIQGHSIKSNKSSISQIIKQLPFELTNSQKMCVDEIIEDMTQPERMLRLLQGDVGSGKTIVAFLGLMHAVNAKKQCAFMAPTELLASQHYETLKNYCFLNNVSLKIITGKTRNVEKDEIYSQLTDGSLDIVIGTHALFQEKVVFKDLGFVVIDEQHRFGVHQRLSLTSKNQKKPPDILLMTATPIPRTLELTTYGSMSVSKIVEKPHGIQIIETAAKPIANVDKTIKSLEKIFKNNGKAYWVCPLIEESEKIDLAAAEDRYLSLKDVYGDNVLLIHGRIPSDEREKIMSEFKFGNKRILVATTVIEVGIDVPEATVMIIEHAERFGLSQLHQLRGRVGRGINKSSCLLLYQTPLGINAKKRIETLRETNDGFVIAEEDLILRGAGEILGTRQSGFHIFKIANLNTDRNLLELANKNANYIVSKGLLNSGSSAENFKLLLHLFKQDRAIKFLEAG
ncbi:MAG: ATP-dependent DNA helicase RecG [Pseudomonadota bacterium]|nr:ATP-dependent DNA helicase RecG [Pseudomonadota bacterium]